MCSTLLVFNIFCSVILFTLVGCSHYVPVYMLNDPEIFLNRYTELAPLLHHVSEEEFKKVIDGKISTLMVFAEKTLSSEDFALRDTQGELIFSSISSLKDSHSTYWPLVNNPITAVTQLFNTSIVKTSIKKLLENPVLVQNNGILLVDLNDAIDGEDRLDMLKRHDKDITEVYKKYIKDNNITAMLTSYSSSWVFADELRSPRNKREANTPLLHKDEPPVSEVSNRTYKNKDLMIYVSSTANLSYYGNRVPLNDFELSPESKRDNSSMNSTLTSKLHPDISLIFQFKFARGYWSLTNISIENTTGSPYYLWVRDVYGPIGFSYHCHQQTFYNLSHSDVNLTLPGFQMQAFFNTTKDSSQKFGEAYDCVGFMSTPIWSGLFVTFIMALIMTFGLSMMMNIKTMDRFDDPKGKTITVTASE